MDARSVTQALPRVLSRLSWGTTVILELYRRHREVVHSMVLAGGYAGWRGSLGAEEAGSRLAGVRAAADDPGADAADWGALDVRSPLAVAHRFECQIPEAALAVIPGCGHVSNLDAPRSFTTVVRAFLHDPG